MAIKHGQVSLWSSIGRISVVLSLLEQMGHQLRALCNFALPMEYVSCAGKELRLLQILLDCFQHCVGLKWGFLLMIIMMSYWRARRLSLDWRKVSPSDFLVCQFCDNQDNSLSMDVLVKCHV